MLLLSSTGVFADDGNGSQDGDGPDLQPVPGHHGTAHQPHVGARTVDFWSGNVTLNGQDYPYQIVGSDPAAEGASTVTVDIVPVDVKVRGSWFRGSDVVDPVLASPLFQSNDYGSASHASGVMMSRGSYLFPMGSGGNVSAGNSDAQLLDATMRSEFGRVGSGYHLYLNPSAVHKPVTIEVPDAQNGAPLTGTITATRMVGTQRISIVFADVDQNWFMTNIESLAASLHYLEPHRLALFVTNDVLLFKNGNMGNIVFGDHGVTDTTAEGNGSNGRQALQTYVWSSWMTSGFFNPASRWAMQDIYGLSHELVEWANDPFGTNVVPNWRSGAAPQYGCNNLLETGDPVVGMGLTVGANTFVDAADHSYSTARPHGFGDGSYHVSDEVFLPWFFGAAPNTLSQETQTASTNGGRYTFLGDLNTISQFHGPATGC